ncbi:ABC transporter ATP-binding protein [Halobaculum sp. EA56]|uniref:ABC transporter ATP-binding protein n=1 Tax=Halobaculum sp. EA56 TaxID=3421648 RepID=UPI003EB76BBA
MSDADADAGADARRDADRERDPDGGADNPLVAAEGLEKHYPITEGLFAGRVGAVRAVDGVDLAVRRGEAVGLIGESGCGKSTAAACLLGLEEPTGGTVRFDGDPVAGRSGEALARFRRRTATVFQDPNGSLDPRMTAGESAAEPLAVHGVDDRRRRRAIVGDLFERVGLDAGTLDRYPHELSGGQKQRVGIARALSTDPEFVVLDEPVSGLDVSVQAEILALLSELREAFDLSLLFISHDVSVVREVCDRVAVMYAGEVVERGATGAVLSDPHHPYTEALVAAVPTPDPHAGRARSPLSGDVPDPAELPDGCRFHPRCPSVIPPAETDLTSDEYRAVLDLRRALAAGEADPDGLRELAAAGRDASPDDLDGAALAGALREEYGLAEPLGDESAEATLAAAVETAVAGRTGAAAEALRDAFSSVCERERPERYPTGAGRTAACHLHREQSGEGGRDPEPPDP